MVDALNVKGPDGVTRSLDEHYDGMDDVKEDPYGAWLAIQNQAARIAELEAALVERDGGVHDQDCKVLRGYGPKVCTCGHEEVARLINKEPKP